MYLHKYDVIDDKEGVGLPNVYTIVTITEFRHDERPGNKQEFINKQAKD